MFISKLKLLNFRNYNFVDINIPKEGIIFTGDNGSGKTSILEAIHFLSVGRSQRSALAVEMLKKDCSEFYIEATFEKNKKSEVISVGYSGKKKKKIIKKNGNVIKSYHDWFYSSNVMSFSPDDSNIVYGSPTERRKFFDIVLSKIDEEYMKNLYKYKRNILNRNAILTSGKNFNLLDTYEKEISESAFYIKKERVKLISEIKDKFFKNYKFISNGSENSDILEIESFRYEDDYKQELIDRLKKKRDKDSIVGFTTIGPHRDDYCININGKPAKKYGSKGQCRSMAISLKLSIIDYIYNKTSDNVIILLDDAFSELDENRIRRIFDIIDGSGQIILTSLADINFLNNFKIKKITDLL